MSCKMIKLSLDDIKEDLKNANPDDVVFNKNIFSKLTGKGTATKNEVSKEDNCYNDVLQFLHGEEELWNLIGELKIKQEDLADMKEQLQEWMVKLSGESTDENKMKTSAEVVEDEIVPEHESKEDNDVIIESIEDELEEVSTDEFDANEGVINAVSLSENNTLDDSSSDSSDDLQDAPSSITQALLDESTDSNENEGDDNWEVEDDDLVIDDSSNDSD